MDLFDPKPKLNELDGQALPESLTKNVRFAFIQKETARVMGSSRKFTPRGECGMELSDYLPHLGECADDICLIRSMHTDAFNHHPGQLLMNCGSTFFGRPSMGLVAHLWAGQRVAKPPGLRGADGRHAAPAAAPRTGRAASCPRPTRACCFAIKGDPVLHLGNPAGFSADQQGATIDALEHSEPTPCRTACKTLKLIAGSPLTSWPSACSRLRA